MSLYSEYLNEVYSKNVLEDQISMVIWSMDDGVFYIEDIYIKPEFRSNGIGREIVDSLVIIAKENGCNKLLGSISLLCAHKEENMRKFLKYGFKISSVGSNIIFLMKDI